MSVWGRRTLDFWEVPGCGIGGRGNLDGSGGRVYQAQGIVIPSDDAGGIPAAGFRKTGYIFRPVTIAFPILMLFRVHECRLAKSEKSLTFAGRQWI
jgi:hypothetical protein